MARSKQTATAQDRPVWHKRSFLDHAGQQATRLRLGTANVPIPEDFKQNIVFAFQVYTTIPISTSASATETSEGSGDGSSTKRTKGESDVDVSMTSDLKSLGEWLGGGLSDAQRPSPVWEIYPPQTDVFACVEHQKREIAHRKAKREQQDTLMIPMVAKGQYGERRRSGFCIVITSPFFRQDILVAQSDSGDHIEPGGPLWVHFHRPSSTPTLNEGPLQETPGMQVEIGAERKQKVSRMEGQLTQMYFRSCAPNGTYTGVGGISVALNQDESLLTEDDTEIATDEPSTEPEAITRLAGQLSLDQFDVQDRDGTVIVTSASGEPDLRYVVYVLHAANDALIEQIAKAFTQAITSHLQSKTVSFEFRRSPEPTLSSVLSANLAALEDNHVGALTNDGKRIHPLARQPGARINDPDTCGFAPYRTCLLIMDKPANFFEGSGVLLLLTDGGKGQLSETDPEGHYYGPKFDYEETIVWRCNDMERLAKRLAMEEVLEREAAQANVSGDGQESQ